MYTVVTLWLRSNFDSHLGISLSDTVPLKGKLPLSQSHFSQVHWKYQYFAFVDIQTFLCIIVTICAVGMTFILISDACV